MDLPTTHTLVPTAYLEDLHRRIFELEQGLLTEPKPPPREVVEPDAPLPEPPIGTAPEIFSARAPSPALPGYTPMGIARRRLEEKAKQDAAAAPVKKEATDAIVRPGTAEG